MISNGNEEHILDKRIVAAREAAGFSITQAAQKLGFKNYQTLSAIEKGIRKINAHELIMMARLYGRNLDYFLESNAAPDPLPLWRKTKKLTQIKFSVNSSLFWKITVAWSTCLVLNGDGKMSRKIMTGMIFP